MKRLGTFIIIVAAFTFVISLGGGLRAEENPAKERNEDLVSQGGMRVLGEDGKPVLELPLKHTSVKADVSGYIARVDVTQTFQNPFKEKIEAVYVFPLPNRAAVDAMTMKIGDRVIIGQIKKREEAKEIYEKAKAAGHVAALLEQERPNIFTQSVANIEPGKEIEVVISYVEELKYDHGHYQFVFPMVVGPRYIPGAPTTTPEGGGWSPDTTKVPDASKITPPVMKPDTRSGHDIDVTVKLDAGVPIVSLESKSHKITVQEIGKATRSITLDPADTIPNKDLIIDYNVAGDSPEIAVLTHGKDGQGFFTMIIQPKANFEAAEITPKELIFVVDRSGSMSGFPIETIKTAMKKCLTGMNPDDTFQIIGFSNDAQSFAPAPVANTKENVEKGMAYIDAMVGSGGTEMLKGVQEAFSYPMDEKRLRIVFLMTDGYIGNEKEILKAVSDNCKVARMFSFGVGSSVNRYFIDGLAEMGRGIAFYIRQNQDPSAQVEEFFEKISKPYLTNIEIDYGGLKTSDILPLTIPDLFSSQPLVLHGRYTEAGSGKITVKGKIAGKPFERVLDVEFPKDRAEHDVLGTLWARTKIHYLENAYICDQSDKNIPELVTNLALDFKLMSQYTSFVAVEEQTITEGGQPKKVLVPVQTPEGVSYEGVFGSEDKDKMREVNAMALPAMQKGLQFAVGEEEELQTVRPPVLPLNADGTLDANVLRKSSMTYVTEDLVDNVRAAYPVAILRCLKDDGAFNLPEKTEQPLKVEALALWTLYDAYGRNKNDQQKETIQKTVDRLVKLRDAKSGLWPATPGGETPDALTSAWAALALATANKAGLKVDAETLASLATSAEKAWKEGDAANPLWLVIYTFTASSITDDQKKAMLDALDKVAFAPEFKSDAQQTQLLLLMAALKLDEAAYNKALAKILTAYGDTSSPLIRRMMTLKDAGFAILK
jgi:Ca-activated chloride channel family protein